MLDFAINILAASILLLFAVRQVRLGVERSFGQRLNVMLEQRGPAGSCLSGIVLAIFFQGATGVILMTAGLVSAGAIPLYLGLALSLGADLGSAIVIKVLSFDLSLLLPMLLFIGGWLYLKTSNAVLKNAGRALFGVGLILLSLQMISLAVAPLKGATHLNAVSALLGGDQVLVLFVGIVITFALHSSVASILVGSILFAQGAFSPAAAASFVFGCNIGSVLIPVWLTRGAEMREKELPILNLIVRGSSAILYFMLFLSLPIAELLFGYLGKDSHLIGIHLLFNATNLIFVPFAASICAAYSRLMPDRTQQAESHELEFTGVAMAKYADSDNSELVLQRDVASMLDSVSRIIADAGRLIETNEDRFLDRIVYHVDVLSNRMSQLRAYYAEFGDQAEDRQQFKHNRQLFEYALRLNRAGQSLVGSLQSVSSQLRDNGLAFSPEGIAELLEVQKQVLSSSLMSFDMITTSSKDLARRLVHMKKSISTLEQKSRRKHFKRLASGNMASFLTSDLHVEIAEELKATNNKVASYAFAVLDAKGELNSTRLKLNQST
ncbi:Na/Pi cotransporter family protein [Maritalea sp.]|uniref:Na/Pi cotransporter family protein n=1 Tax=Maritalea sp. TaxID=2003361 RepID=UPI003EF9C60F